MPKAQVKCPADGQFCKFEQAVWRRIVQLTTGFHDHQKGYYVDELPPTKPPRSGRTLEYDWRLKSIQVWVRDHFLEGILRADAELASVREVFKYIEGGRDEDRDDPMRNLRRIYRARGIADEKKLAIRRAAWNYPGLFCVKVDNRRVEDSVECTPEAEQLYLEEQRFKDPGDEQSSIRIIKKILMMTRERRIRFRKLVYLSKYCNLPRDLLTGFISRHPEHFRMVDTDPRGLSLELVSWDDSLAVTEREKAVAEGRTSKADGPYAFVISYPPWYLPNRVRREELDAFQQVEFPSPYSDAPLDVMDYSTPSGQKRVLAVYHELLSFTLEKRALVRHLALFARELRLPLRYPQALLDCHPGIFYISHWENRFYAFLREGYRGDQVKEKNPAVLFRERYLELMKIQPRELYEDKNTRFVPKRQRGVVSNRDHLREDNWTNSRSSRSVTDDLCVPIPE